MITKERENFIASIFLIFFSLSKQFSFYIHNNLKYDIIWGSYATFSLSWNLLFLYIRERWVISRRIDISGDECRSLWEKIKFIERESPENAIMFWQLSYVEIKRCYRAQWMNQREKIWCWAQYNRKSIFIYLLCDDDDAVRFSNWELNSIKKYYCAAAYSLYILQLTSIQNKHFKMHLIWFFERI